MISVKKQTPSMCKLRSFYDEEPEKFLDEKDVGLYFYHIFDTSKSLHGLALVSKVYYKNFVNQMFQFCCLKTQQHYIFQ